MAQLQRRFHEIMLIRLLYVSKPIGPVTTHVTSSILEVSRVNNKANGITGVLCQGSGLYMQILEGQRSVINALLCRIMADKRHQAVELLAMEEISQRRFGQWSMALVHLSQDDPMVKMSHPEFDPYCASSSDAMKLIDQLIESGSPINTMK
jgi:hypothetical protein